MSLSVYVRSCGAQWSVCLGALVSLLGPLVTGVKPDLRPDLRPDLGGCVT